MGELQTARNIPDVFVVAFPPVEEAQVYVAKLARRCGAPNDAGEVTRWAVLMPTSVATVITSTPGAGVAPQRIDIGVRLPILVRGSPKRCGDSDLCLLTGGLNIPHNHIQAAGTVGNITYSACASTKWVQKGAVLLQEAAEMTWRRRAALRGMRASRAPTSTQAAAADATS